MSTTTSSTVTLQDNAATPVSTDVTKSNAGKDIVIRTSDDGAFTLTHRSSVTRAGRSRKIASLRKDWYDADGVKHSAQMSATLDFQATDNLEADEVAYMFTRFLSVNSYDELEILRAGHYYG